MKNFFRWGIMFILLSFGYANDEDLALIDELKKDGYKISETLRLDNDDLSELGEKAAHSFLKNAKNWINKHKDKKSDKPIVITLLKVENVDKKTSSVLVASFESTLDRMDPNTFSFTSQGEELKAIDERRDDPRFNLDTQPESNQNEAPKVQIFMSVHGDSIKKKDNVEKTSYILSVHATNTTLATKEWVDTFSLKKAMILEKKESEKLREYKRKLEEQKIESERIIEKLELEKKQIKNESELKQKQQELDYEIQKQKMLQARLEEQIENQKKIENAMVSNQSSQSARDTQSTQSNQTEAVPSLSFLASQKGTFWLIGFEGGVGERFTPNYNDSAQASFSFRNKIGGGYRWNADYALSAFVTYEATFQDRGIVNTKDELEITHSLGFGAMFQFLKYFYASTGALVDVKDLGSEYISRTHENINPFIEFGGILMTDKYIGFSLGLRYVFALGDGKYLNRGISCSAGILFGI